VRELFPEIAETFLADSHRTAIIETDDGKLRNCSAQMAPADSFIAKGHLSHKR
jgi:hypothetical protein